MSLFGPPNVMKLLQQRKVAGLIKALRHQDWHIRRDAAKALGELGDPRGVEPLIAALEDESFGRDFVRSEAAEALGRIRDNRAAIPLIAALSARRASDEVIGRALRNIGDKRAVEPLVQALVRTMVRVPSDLERAVAFSRKELEQALDALDPNWVDSRAAKEALPVLMAKRIDRESDRDAAARLLAKIDPSWAACQAGTIPTLIAKLGEWESADPTSVRALLKEIASQRTSEAVSLLVAALADERAAVRLEVAEVLGDLGNARAVEPLCATLSDKDEFVRMKAAVALGKLQDANAIERLIATVLDDRNMDAPNVLGAACQALNRIDPTWVRSQVPSRIAHRLVIALGSDERWREEARKALQSMGRAAADSLAAALRDDDLVRRWAATSLIAELRDPRAAEPLVEWFEAELGARHRVNFYKEMKETLVRLGDAAVCPLIATFERRPFETSAVTKILGEIGDPRAVGPLITGVADTGVAGAAIRALEQILGKAWAAARVSTDELRRIARFEKVLQDVEEAPGGAIIIKVGTKPVDCSRVTDLANRELSRRG